MSLASDTTQANALGTVCSVILLAPIRPLGRFRTASTEVIAPRELCTMPVRTDLS